MTQPDPKTAAHPSWCDRHRGPDWSAHTAQVGVDLVLTSEVTYAVVLFQQGHADTELHLVHQTATQTAITRLSPLEAAIHRDTLTKALQLVATEAGR